MSERAIRSLRPAADRQCGLSLIELIFFIVIVSVALAGVLSVMNISAAKSSDPLVHKQLLAIAEATMEEVLAKDFQNDQADATNSSSSLGCTPTTTVTCRVNTPADRQNYNDVLDYQGWSQLGVYRVDGTLVPGLGNYRVQISVAGATAAPMSTIGARQITVTVTANNETISLVGYRANYELPY